MDTQWAWVYTAKGELVCLDEDDSDFSYLAGVYPDAIYFLAGVAPLPLED